MHRDQVHQSLCKALQNDRSRTHVLPMSKLGLIEMTRKRTQGSLGRSYTEVCTVCEGNGSLRSPKMIVQDLLRATMREARIHSDAEIVIQATPRVAGLLAGERRSHLAELEGLLGRPVVVESSSSLKEPFQILAR